MIFVFLAACGSDSAPGTGGPGPVADSGSAGEDAASGGDDASMIAADASDQDAAPGEDASDDDGAVAGDGAADDATSGTDDAGVGEAGVADDAGAGEAGVADAIAGDAETEDAIAGDGGAADAIGGDALAGDAIAADAIAGDAIAGDAIAGDTGPAGPDAGNLCTSSLDCIAGVEACGDIRSTGTTIETHCTPLNPSPPAAPVGGACTADSQCRENLCLDTFANECTVICADAMRDCPAGHSCTGYRFNPGMVWVYMCSRSCQDNSGCGAGAGGNPGNVCSPQVYQRGASWFADNVCQVPAGPGALGSPCAGGNDCQSGLCLTTTRATSCTGPAGCMADETCECPAGGAPPCAGGAAAECVSRLCSNVCNDNSDCAGGGALTTCATDILLGLPDGSTIMLPSCARN